jgi:hypothetical protein
MEGEEKTQGGGNKCSQVRSHEPRQIDQQSRGGGVSVTFEWSIGPRCEEWSERAAWRARGSGWRNGRQGSWLRWTVEFDMAVARTSPIDLRPQVRGGNGDNTIVQAKVQ